MNLIFFFSFGVARNLIPQGNANPHTDSSRRAVEAADNVVHAYDMNMGVPDTPLSPMDEDTIRDPAAELAYRQKKTIVVTGNNIPINFRGLKRRRDEIGNPPASPAKRPAYDRRGVPELSGPESRRPSVHKLENPEDAAAAAVAAAAAAAMGLGGDVRAVPRTSLDQGSHLSSPLYTTEHTVVPGLRHTDLRDVLQYVVNDSLKVGGRPESAIARETEIGEHIEVRLTDSAGAERVKAIEWSVDPGVPETMLSKRPFFNISLDHHDQQIYIDLLLTNHCSRRERSGQDGFLRLFERRQVY